ncbi:hypothetical protein [Wenjunlia tyrosinilytica]|uniref:Uncharacterized protein n=1 Tax=Wenjunlia tyrosinilytica TaxID=1544741 RepID=A0A917ZW63_9ACTN|nr:hypothetical protein [Wenjunlia tyrosinilytica]GGO96941.1 hypothetical protein GCM10012280_57580 [Wenjunlia tyrosinilytica]
MSVVQEGEALDRAFVNQGQGRGTLWEEERVGRQRMADPVRRSAVRAFLIGAVTLIEVNVAVLGTLGGSWIAAPATLAAVVSTIVATWAVLDVWVTRQVHVQRHGVVSTPSSAARPARGHLGLARRSHEGRATGSPQHLSSRAA